MASVRNNTFIIKNISKIEEMIEKAQKEHQKNNPEKKKES